MTQVHGATGSPAAIAAIAYAIKADEGVAFLRCWQHGDFDAIRAEWPDAPVAVFPGTEAPESATAGRGDLAQERAAFAEQVIGILESSASAWDAMLVDEPDEVVRERMRARSNENRGNIERIRVLLAQPGVPVPHSNCPAPVDATEAKEREHMGCAHCGTGVYAAGLARAADIAETICSQSRNHLFRSAAKIIAGKIRAELPEPAPRGGDVMLQAFNASGLKPTAGNRRAFRSGFVAAAPPPVVWNGQPIETILYWADAYSGSGFGGGHGMMVKLLHEYAELCELVAAFGASIRLAPFQWRVQPWMLECFGATIAADRMERNHRFFEEATELVQANGMTCSEAHQLVDYTFGRPPGELKQEIGGVMVTLAALCLASGEDMHLAGEAELARIWTKVDKIRAKQAAKPKHSPLPEYVPAANSVDSLLRDRISQIAMDADAAANLGGNRHMAITLADISDRLLQLSAPPAVSQQDRT